MKSSSSLPEKDAVLVSSVENLLSLISLSRWHVRRKMLLDNPPSLSTLLPPQVHLCVVCPWQGGGGVGLQGGLCEERPGLPWPALAGSSWFQPVAVSSSWFQTVLDSSSQFQQPQARTQLRPAAMLVDRWEQFLALLRRSFHFFVFVSHYPALF